MGMNCYISSLQGGGEGKGREVGRVGRVNILVGGGMNDNHVSLPNVAAAGCAWKANSIL